jgi:7-cyano-7-deazaguanine reductase
MVKFKNNFMLEDSELGKKSAYESIYNPDILLAIPRKPKRDEIAVPDILPFYGFDLWNHYEVSWLNQKGKPIVALAELTYSCNTPNIIESKSMKLYFNSFNNTKFHDEEIVKCLVEKDLAARVGGLVSVHIFPVLSLGEVNIETRFDGVCIDDLDVECTAYMIDTSFLTVENHYLEEIVYSDLLKSNCLVTNQPDWGSIQITYKGRQINHEGLLRYLVSFRNHNEFHEQCIERIFMDIMRHCQPQELTIIGRYTRRGGLDINPCRSTNNDYQKIMNTRLVRQ